MILIVGGEGSGKRTFAKSLGYREEDMADGCLDDRPVIFHTERLVFQAPEGADLLYEGLLKKEVVICNEVGSGVIPMEQRERQGREAVGRLCVQLAARADAVVRMVCGIPSVIRGKLS